MGACVVTGMIPVETNGIIIKTAAAVASSVKAITSDQLLFLRS